MNKKLNKKGFTIVELVIVIAVIAILAAVLIPTFVSLTRKANIANDTAVAKNLNTAAIAAQADTFDEAIAAAKEAGYLIANLNAKADKCYIVWEDETNQFLLYDTKEKEIIYSNSEVTGDPDASWCFAVNNPDDEKEVKAVWADVTIKMLVVDVKDLASILASGGDIYLDESIVLDKENFLQFKTSGTTVTLNLGNSQLTSDGTLENQPPIEVQAGVTVILNGGVIGASGSGVDLDGKVYKTPFKCDEGSVIEINNTLISNPNGPVQFAGTATLNNVKCDTYFYAYANGQVVLNNCSVDNQSDVALWVTNTVNGPNGTATLTVNSGKYVSRVDQSTKKDCYGAISVYGGTINLVGGEFVSATANDMFCVKHESGKIVVSGGTFNNVAFEDLDEKAIYALCVGGEETHVVNVVRNEDGSLASFTITKK